MQNLYNINVAALEVLPTPEEIKQRLPLSEAAADTVFQGRETVQRILDRQDPRLFVVVGPCSIHDVEAALDYARRLKTLADEVQDTLFVIMRVYFEKPRTTVGWKGLINDPRMDDTFRIDEGLEIARRLLLDLAEMGLPAGTEALDPIIPQYISDLIAWTAIGARTTESQTHREIASGLSMPVGFKNGTNGSLEVAINALQSAARPHSFLGINPFGQSAVIRTLGNRYGHVVLRGGDRPNYDSVSIALCEKALREKKLPVNIVVDCSHANSFKDPAMQPLVMRDCVHQVMEGNQSIVGLMVESNIGWGNQSIPADRGQLKYGVSITDACVDWPTTEKMLRETHAKLKGVLPGRLAT
ncbi:MAG: 3-deoxy-7-phosphoheptulonate synthase [Candidatus Competibacter sp.]|nr:3-deoxy-7-phosphoheptulonate synthase [Candidatus Competibacter sp.]